MGSEPLVTGAGAILHNQRFLNAARALFGSSSIRPKLVVVNLNAPMPAGPTHVDVPTFRGATREHYPIAWLVAMGRSELFENWRVIQAGAVAWFYDGRGGNFEYWPEGLDGPMFTERPPFHNVRSFSGSYHAATARLPRRRTASRYQCEIPATFALEHPLNCGPVDAQIFGTVRSVQDCVRRRFAFASGLLRRP